MITTKRTKLSEKTISRILELHFLGRSERAIASKLGVSRSAVWYQIQKAKSA